MDTKCIKKILHNKNFVFYLLGILWIGILSNLLYSGCRPRNFYDENENLYVSAIYKYTNSADYVLICLGKTKDDIKKRKDCFLVSYGRGRDDDDDFASFYKVKNQDSIFIECPYSDVWIIRSSNFYMERKFRSDIKDYIKENTQSVWKYSYSFDYWIERVQIVDGFHSWYDEKPFTHFIFELKE